jgi:hypothetical protein
MDGTATVGIAATYARGDHVHPSDTTKANLANPVFTGTPTLPTGTIGVTQTYPNSSTALATTAFVSTNFAPINSPAFTGIPTAPTAGSGTSTTQLATTAFVLSTRHDQLQAPTAPVSWGNQGLINLLDPVNAQDAATKHYVDANSAGLVAKGAVMCATAGANITLSGLQTIDGYTTLAGDRVLVKDQTTQANNGIYVAATTAWARATDMNTWAQVPQAYVFVSNGTVNANSSWTCNSPASGTLGTTAITWVQFSQQASVTAGNGLTRVGNQFSVVGTANRIVVAAAVDIAANYVGQSSINTLGAVTTGTWNGTPVTVSFGGTGVTTLAAGYVKSNGTSAFTSLAQVPNTDVAGLGSMALQGAGAVAITGGTIDGVTFDMGTF